MGKRSRGRIRSNIFRSAFTNLGDLDLHYGSAIVLECYCTEVTRSSKITLNDVPGSDLLR
jgi:hypothetical protein